MQDWLKNILVLTVGLVASLFVVPLNMIKSFFSGPSAIPVAGKVIVLLLIVLFWIYVYTK